ncbi:MAG: hypothetical protein U9O82_01625 [Thermodesulfobacteriota bacterium]|nr:hypothetical protein [Thermodesulfobacteriota bacterium]
MILFCEDCGEKNFIDLNTITTDIVEFRCRECSYLNRVKMPEAGLDTEQTAAPGNEEPGAVHERIEQILQKLGVVPGKIKRILEELGALPGVTGSFIFHTKNGVTAKRISDAVDEENLASIGSILEENYRLGQRNFRDITGVSLILKKSALVLRKVTGDVFLVLVGTSANAAGRLEELLDSAVDELRSCFPE